MSGRLLLVVSLALVALALPALGASAGEEPRPAERPAPLVRIDVGRWLLYKGTLKVVSRRVGDEPSELQAALEAAYLGLGASGRDGAAREVLLLRAGESPEDKDIAASEAVSLLADPDLGLRAELPVEDRAGRVSTLLFNYLPLGIFPPLSDPAPREWRGPARLNLLHSDVRELSAAHRVEAAPAGAIRYTVEADPGQKVALKTSGMEPPFQVSSLRQAYTISPAGGKLLAFESRLAGSFVESEGPVAEVRVAVDLAQSEVQDLKDARWLELREEARLVREVERVLFVGLDPEAAKAKAASFEKEHRGSRLARFAAGLALQADDVWPIANERRLYGKAAPDFTLKDLSGKEWRLQPLLPGKVTLLAFWGVG